MLKPILERSVPLLSALLLVQCILLLTEWKRSAATRREINSVSSETTRLKVKTEKKLVAYDVISEQDAKLEEFLSNKEAVTGRSGPGTPAPGSQDRPPIVTAMSLRTKMAAILADPTKSAALRQIKVDEVNGEYAIFFGRMGKPNNMAKVKDLLVDLKMAQVDATALLPDGLSKQEEQAAVKTLTQGIEDELRQQLGDADFASLKTFEASWAVREDVKTFGARLAEANMPLPAEQLARIEARWMEARPAGDDHPSGLMGTDTNLETLISTAADMLTPEQLALLRKFLLDRGKR